MGCCQSASPPSAPRSGGYERPVRKQPPSYKREKVCSEERALLIENNDGRTDERGSAIQDGEYSTPVRPKQEVSPVLETVEKETDTGERSIPIPLEAPRIGHSNVCKNPFIGLVTPPTANLQVGRHHHLGDTPTSDYSTMNRNLTLEEGGRLLQSSQRNNSTMNRRVLSMQTNQAHPVSPSDCSELLPPGQLGFDLDDDDDNMVPASITYRSTYDIRYSLQNNDAMGSIVLNRTPKIPPLESSLRSVNGVATMPAAAFRKIMTSDPELYKLTGWSISRIDDLIGLLCDSSGVVQQEKVEHLCTCKTIFDNIDVTKKGEFAAWDMETALRDNPDVAFRLIVPPYLATPLLRHMAPRKASANFEDFFSYFHDTDLQQFGSNPIQSYQDVFDRLLPKNVNDVVKTKTIKRILKEDRYLFMELGWSEVTGRNLDNLGPTPKRADAELLLKLRWAWSRIDTAHDGFIGRCELGDALEESDVARCLSRSVGDVKTLWKQLDVSGTGVCMWHDFYKYFLDDVERSRRSVLRRPLPTFLPCSTPLKTDEKSIQQRPMPKSSAPLMSAVAAVVAVTTSEIYTKQKESHQQMLMERLISAAPVSTTRANAQLRKLGLSARNTPEQLDVTPRAPPPIEIILPAGRKDEQQQPQPRPQLQPQPQQQLANNNNASALQKPTDMPKRGTSPPGKTLNFTNPQFPQAAEQRYTKLKKLGEGNFGVVFLVERKTDGLLLVTKEPKRLSGWNTPHKRNQDAKRMRKSQKEAAHLMRLRHPNILRFIEAYWDQGALIIVTEYCGGGDLSSWLTRHRTTSSVSTKWSIFEQVAEALRYLHDRNILHRDLKPANILLTNNGLVKLADFGLARALPEDERAYTICGTELYMAPEVHSRSPYGKPTDIFALGCILFQMAKGRKPFVNLSELIECKPPSDAPSFCRRLVRDMLSKDPLDRPSIGQVLRRCPEHRPKRRRAKLLLLTWMRKADTWPDRILANIVLSFIMHVSY
eukprot:TRINITY_DN16518_c0_g2_i1.p1 TRINITY_DN16518_c0_g2~~TRINITY_DN16518_c0_g2_i1.p1  ORF type:complete len:989 (+),score=157.59 TRINITY_DN16518_c0_g2_i1:38-3004(+)